MIDYFENLSLGEQEEVKEAVSLLYSQTFVLERKFDKRSGRLIFNREFRICDKHLEFLKKYFEIAGIEVRDNSQTGIIYLQGERLIGEKLSRLATLYVLILKLIYDEQMENVSQSVNAFTTLGEMHERLGSFGVFSRQPSHTEIRRAVAVLKKYQVIEPLDILEELESATRMVIYPSIHMVLLGDDIRALLETFSEADAAKNLDDWPMESSLEEELLDEEVKDGEY